MSDFDDFELPDGDTDLADIPDSNDPPPARYLTRIEKMEMRTRKDGNGSYISIQFKISDVLDPKLEPFIGRSIFDIFNLGAASLWKIKGVIVAARGDDAAKGNRIPNLTGDSIVIDAYEDNYQGRVSLRTRGYKASDSWSGITVDSTADEAPSNGSSAITSAEVEI